MATNNDLITNLPALPEAPRFDPPYLTFAAGTSTNEPETNTAFINDGHEDVTTYLRLNGDAGITPSALAAGDAGYNSGDFKSDAVQEGGYIFDSDGTAHGLLTVESASATGDSGQDNLIPSFQLPIAVRYNAPTAASPQTLTIAVSSALVTLTLTTPDDQDAADLSVTLDWDDTDLDLFESDNTPIVPGTPFVVTPAGVTIDTIKGLAATVLTNLPVTVTIAKDGAEDASISEETTFLVSAEEAGGSFGDGDFSRTRRMNRMNRMAR